MIPPRNIIVFEPNSLEMFQISGVTQEQLDRLDDEENYAIVDPTTKECYVNNFWIPIPEGHFQSDNQLVVIGAKGEAANDPKS